MQQTTSPTRIQRAPALFRASAFLTLTAAALSACTEGTSPNSIAFGSAVVVGGGTARTYVESSFGGELREIGIVLTEAAIAGLPAAGTLYLLPLPQVAVEPYKHVTLNWNPTGHPPAGVFTPPHFDVHFYTITEAERTAISPTDPQFAVKAARTPSAEFIPTGYTRDPGAVPNMGTHWADPSGPEFNGQPFSKTFIYGSWDGAFMFYEPMFTKALLDSKSAIATTVLKIPSRYSKAGSYPTSYKLGFDAGSKEFVIALTGLVPRS